MKTFQKVILPAAMSLAGLTAFEAQALNTTAGIQITNEASMTYKVNNVTQDKVDASASFLVDAKVALAVVEQGTSVETTANTYNPDGAAADDHYLVGVFQVSNAGNVKTVYDLTLTNVVGTTTAVNSINDTKDAADLTGFRFFAGADFLTEITDAAPLTIDKAPDLSSATSTEVYVYAPMTQITGIDNDSYAFNLQVDAVSLIERLPGNDGDATAKTIASYVDPASGDELTTVELQIVSQTADASDVIVLAFPDFTTDPTDPTNEGFVKTASVIWDPINEDGSVTGNAPLALPGAIVRYTITVKNFAATAAADVQVQDVILATADIAFCDTGDDALCEDIAVDTDNGSGGTFAYDTTASTANLVQVDYASFPGGANSTITFTAKVK